MGTRGGRGSMSAMGRTMAVALALAIASPACGAVIDFDGLLDGEQVTNQYGGPTFTNATAIAAGLSLNEFEFPPASGSNVVFDDGGSLTIDFATPVRSVFGHFTYATTLTLSFIAFDLGEALATVTSAFASNLALSGDIGSLPNEWLGSSSHGGIRAVTIAGDPAGGSFTLDDLSFERLPGSSVPEPATLLLVVAGVLGLTRRRGLAAW